MAKHVIKWLLRNEDIRIYINDSFDLVVKEKIRTIQGKYRFDMTAIFKRHDGKLAIWFPPINDGVTGWVSCIIYNAEEIRNEYNIPLTDEMLEQYDAIVTAYKLN